MPPHGRALKVFQGSPHLPFLLPVSPSYISSQSPSPQHPSSSASKPLLGPCPGFAKSSLLPVNSQVFFKALFSTLYYGLCLVAQSCQTLCDLTNCNQAPLSLGDSPGKNTGVGCYTLLQGIFPTQRSNTGLPNYRWILYRLSHQGSPKILEWVAYPFSRGSSQPRN